MAQEAALKEIAGSRLRRFLAFNKSFNCTVSQIGYAVLSYKAHGKKSAPRRRGPALISDIDDTGVTAKFESQVFGVARFCVRKRGEEKDVAEEELGPVRVRLFQNGSGLGDELRNVEVGSEMEVE